jgi:ribonuclease P protein component
MPRGLVTLKTRADFLRVAATREKAVMPGFILQAAPAPLAGTSIRVGYTASRKVGDAVHRNRAKRRLRAIAAAVLARDGRSQTDYVLVARGATGGYRYGALIADLEAAVRRIGARAKSGGATPAKRSEMREASRAAQPVSNLPAEPVSRSPAEPVSC